MERIVINDDQMYRYFDRLFYEEDKAEKGLCEHGLRKDWKRKGLIEPYGLADHNVYEMLGAKSLLYGEEDARQQLYVLDSMQKLLHEYVGIRELEELLINNYGTIENAIFFEHDAEGRPVHIREHAKHQMKNAYIGSVLLLECGYLEDAAQNILAAEGATTAWLSYQAIRAVLGEEEAAGSHEELLLKLQDADCQKAVLSRLEEWVYKIFMVASMLHDIGYPLEYYLRSAGTLTEYPPYLNILSPAVKTDFVQIKANLLESQLFRQIDHKEIRKKYDANDHGVLSAVSLLTYFYHNGKIYSLNQEDRCLIEMAAIAVYRHTDRYDSGFRMVYRKDPVSYLVRLCDDLQEWERFKVIMNDRHNYLQCALCGKMILPEGRDYRCPCGRQSYVKVTQIRNRKLNYICLCDKLYIEKEEGRIRVTVHFDLLKQFEILTDDYAAVLRHDDAMKRLRGMLAAQSMKPQLAVEYFVSNNPDALIGRMLEVSGKSVDDVMAWADSLDTDDKKRNMKEFLEDYRSYGAGGRFGGALEKNGLKYRDAVTEHVRKYFGEVYSLYQYLTAPEA